MYLVALTWDRTINGQLTREVKMAAIPQACHDNYNYVLVGDESFSIRSIDIVADPKPGKPVAYVRLRGSI